MKKTDQNQLLLLPLLFTGIQAQAAVANLNFGTKDTKQIDDVSLSQTVKADISSKATELKRVASGLRRKYIAFITPSVYVAQVFANGPIDQSSIATLKACLLKSMPVTVSMTFVRNVGWEKIVDGFKDVLEENKDDKNKIDVKVEPYSKFLDAVKTAGDVKDKQTYWFTFTQEKDKEHVSFQTNGKEYVDLEGAPGTLLDNFLCLWLCKAPDKGLEKLQDQLLKPGNP